MMQPGDQEFPSKICQNHLGESFSTYVFLELILGLEPLILVFFGNGLNSQGVAIFEYPCSFVFRARSPGTRKAEDLPFYKPLLYQDENRHPFVKEIATFFQSCL